MVRVAAPDDFAVASVLLRLESAAGDVPEEGPAPAGPDWPYATQATTARAAGLHARAFDRPGDVAEQTVWL